MTISVVCAGVGGGMVYSVYGPQAAPTAASLMEQEVVLGLLQGAQLVNSAVEQNWGQGCYQSVLGTVAESRGPLVSALTALQGGPVTSPDGTHPTGPDKFI